MNALYSADPVDLGAQGDLIGAPEPMSIEAVLAGQIAAGRALLMTFYVTHREVKIEAVRGRQAGEWRWQRVTPRSGSFCRGLAIGSLCSAHLGLAGRRYWLPS